MMKLLLDQGLPHSAATLLCEAGINTIHVAEIGLSAADDIDILQIAREHGRVVVTLDADFHALLALSAATSPSVIRIRIERLRAQALTNLLLTVLDEFVEDLEQGVVVTVEPSRVRMRRLPLVKQG
jgi:predicted nuclease of predicted toxin-antitoxin system